MPKSAGECRHGHKIYHNPTESFASGSPDILIDIDAQTHFSWALLGRQPASTTELTLVYCALLALGTMHSAASVSRMVAGVNDDQIEHFMRQITAGGRLRAASDTVVSHIRLRGGGVLAIRHRPI